MFMIASNDLLKILEKKFPNARCELDYNNLFQLLIAVMLSAQTTDKRVNTITPILFSKYQTSLDLSKANVNDVIDIIKPVGLAYTKAKNLINMANILNNDYNGNVPDTFDELIKLPGVGRKTANVILAEGFRKNAIAVDTHVLRVSNRLGITNSSSPNEVEKSLKEFFENDSWSKAHILLLFLGRYSCKAIKPNCSNCELADVCTYINNK